MGLVLGCFERRPGILATDVLGLAPEQAIALQNSWKNVSIKLPDYSLRFFMWLLHFSAHNQEVHRDAHFRILEHPDLASSNSAIKIKAEEIIKHIDFIVTSFPETKSKALDFISKAYLDRGETPEDFENLAFSLLYFLGDCGMLTALAEMAWIHIINRICVHMWYYLESHAPVPALMVPKKLLIPEDRKEH